MGRTWSAASLGSAVGAYLACMVNSGSVTRGWSRRRPARMAQGAPRSAPRRASAYSNIEM